MNRTIFYKQLEHKVKRETVKELDFLHVPLSQLETSTSDVFYMVKEEDLMQPDLISYKVYGTEDLWWLICAHNDIENPFTELQVGMRLNMPYKNELYDYYMKYRQR